jgi:hypothetical protein
MPTRLLRSLGAVAPGVGLCLLGYAADAPAHYVTRVGDKLMEGDREFRFISFNIPNLHYLEDNLPFSEMNPWRFPDEFEIRDALLSVRQMGGRAVRTYTLSVRRSDDDASIPRHVLGPGQFNEAAFVALDRVLQIANETGVRVIIPFVDQWSWFGGIAEYAAFRGKTPREFWTDRQIIDDFKQTVSFLVNRRNTLTGGPYKEDKALLAWETGNEISNPYAWSREIAEHIKSIDSNHLVLDGFHAGERGLKEEPISDPNIDVVSTHHYPQAGVGIERLLEVLKKNRALCAGRKPYLVGEVGFIPTESLRQVFDTAIRDGIAGVLVWSLRFHNRDGGFYWHSEPAGGGLYKAYHWPGFQSGAAYDESAVLRLMRDKAYEIQGSTPPELETPEPPTLFDIQSTDQISWRGSTGAAAYDVERATRRQGPWEIVGMDVDDASLPYRPLFSDTWALPKRSYFYRIRAKNSAGVSEPSNVVGPVLAAANVRVDEFQDFSRMFARSRDVTLVSNNTRRAKEDLQRARGVAGSFLVYRTMHPLTAFRCDVFFTKDVVDLEFLVSKDGLSFTRVEAARRDFYKGGGDYSYWKPVSYEASDLPPRTIFVKLAFHTEAEIARVELTEAAK